MKSGKAILNPSKEGRDELSISSSMKRKTPSLGV
jgi:hypothetical protein